VEEERVRNLEERKACWSQKGRPLPHAKKDVRKKVMKMGQNRKLAIPRLPESASARRKVSVGEEWQAPIPAG